MTTPLACPRVNTRKDGLELSRVIAGKVRQVGVSNFTRHQFESLNRRVPLVA
jgi:predicted oxidoreductase